MKSLRVALIGVAGLFAAAGALADTGETVVKTRCSLCHDGGAGGAPRIGNRTEWEPRAARGKAALYQVALAGKPNTAMMPRGGFRDLSKDEVMAAVDYMVAQSGLKPGLYPEAPPPAAAPAAVAGGVSVAAALSATPQPVTIEVAKVEAPAPKALVEIDDRAITDGVAAALSRELAPPDSKIETYEGMTTVGGVGIKIQTRAGVVTLNGMVKDPEIIERAEAIAKAFDGVKSVNNKLISATLFEWD